MHRDVGTHLTIAQLIETDGPGGAESVLFNLSQELRERGHRVVPLGPVDGEGWLSGLFREARFERVGFRVRRALDPLALRSIVRGLRASRVDVVHSHEFFSAVYGAAAARWLGIPHVITMHGDVGVTDAWRRRAALRWASRQSAATIIVSEGTRRRMQDRLGQRFGLDLSVIRNGVPLVRGSGSDIRKEIGLASDELLVLCVGNLYPVKGHRILLDALATIPHDVFPWRLAIAGRGNEREALLARAREIRVADRVHLLGLRDDVADLLRGSDLYVMPSHREGLPLALLEAMLAGKPIIASAVGGIPEAIDHDVHGLLVPAGEVQALAEAVRSLFADPEKRSVIGRAAQLRGEAEFTIASMTNRHEELYRAVLGGKMRKPSGRHAL